MLFRVTITPTGGGQPFLLADNSEKVVSAVVWNNGASGVVKEGFLPGQERLVQVTELVRSAYAFVAERQNLKNSLAFTVQRTFKSVETCLQFLAGHNDLVPLAGELQLTVGQTNRYLSNCKVRRPQTVYHVGESCAQHYELIAGAAWQNNP